MYPLLNGLNDEQLKAVLHTTGPCLVVAGAGSGKTKVLTTRIAYLIRHRRVNPSNIIAITFTNKAAREMKERVLTMVDIKASDLWISTFHSTCVRILRKSIHLLGYRKNFVIYDEDDALKLLRTVMKELKIDDKEFLPKIIMGMISDAKNEYLFPEDLKNRESDYNEKTFYYIYKKYQEELKNNNACDFDDLLLLTVKLFKTEEKVLSFYQRKFEYVLVDEYQDTNKLQFEFVNLIAKRYQNLFVVGDIDQSIYSWRGADIRNIREFERDFKDAKKIYLEQNYRSSQYILDAANSVIQNNYEKGDHVKKLWSNKRGKTNKITHYKARETSDEVEYICNKIKEFVSDHGYRYSDIAILYRVNSLTLNLEKGLAKNRINYTVYGNVGFFQRKEIKDLMAYLRLIINPHDNISYLRVINEPKRGIGQTTLDKLIDYAIEKEYSLFEASRTFEARGKAKNALSQFVSLIEHLREQVKRENVTTFIDTVLEETGYLEYLKQSKKEESEDRIENLMQFKTITAEAERDFANNLLNDGGSLGAIDRLNLILTEYTLDTSNKQENREGVKLMTIHAAKGLEFPIVFIYGLSETIFPSNKSISEGRLDEERRLMYVALTRAKEHLFLTNAEEVALYGRFDYLDDSMFIHEIDDRLIDHRGGSAPKKFSSYRKSNYRVGDRIVHRIYGKGIVSIVKQELLTIVFKNGIIKRFPYDDSDIEALS